MLSPTLPNIYESIEHIQLHGIRVYTFKWFIHYYIWLRFQSAWMISYFVRKLSLPSFLRSFFFLDLIFSLISFAVMSKLRPSPFVLWWLVKPSTWLEDKDDKWICCKLPGLKLIRLDSPSLTVLGFYKQENSITVSWTYILS